MTNILSMISFAAILTIAILTNKDKLKKLSVWQNIGICLSFVGAIAVATSLIYYVGNWLVGSIYNGFLKGVISFSIVIFVMGVVITGL